jgi:hypothetical protein
LICNARRRKSMRATWKPRDKHAPLTERSDLLYRISENVTRMEIFKSVAK